VPNDSCSVLASRECCTSRLLAKYVCAGQSAVSISEPGGSALDSSRRRLANVPLSQCSLALAAVLVDKGWLHSLGIAHLWTTCFCAEGSARAERPPSQLQEVVQAGHASTAHECLLRAGCAATMLPLRPCAAINHEMRSHAYTT